MEETSKFSFSNGKNNEIRYVRKFGFFSSFLSPLFFGIVGGIVGISLIYKVPVIKENLAKYAGINFETIQTQATCNNCLPNISDINLKDFNNTSIGVAKKVIPSIVNIEIEFDVTNIFQGNAKSKASGSGIIIDEKGYILTNNHVVNPESSSSFYEVTSATKIYVTLSNDERVEAKIVGTDKTTDLAVIKIEKNNLTPATLGNSDNVQIGEFVMAVGSPLGFKSSVTNGIVSGVNRKVTLKDGSSFNSIQTNASINSGNSGGALVNAKGEVIGVNTLKLLGNGVEGLGFAIPINETKTIVESLINNKKVERPSLGIKGTQITDEMAEAFGITKGILIKEITKNSTADKAGLKQKDILTKINNIEVLTFSDVEKLKTNLKINDEITFTVNRSGEEIKLKTKIVAIQEDNTKNNQENKNSNEKNNENTKKKQQQENLNKFFNEFFNDLD